MKIQAAVLREADKPFEVEQLDLDESPRDDEVLVRVVAVGLCHTDLLARELPEAFFRGPFVAGHEGAGVVEAVGAGVSHVAPGDHVVLSFAYCDECVPCRSGHPAYCLRFVEHNFANMRLDGSSALRDETGISIGSHFFGQSSFASHAMVAARSVVKIDKSYDLTKAGPLGCGIQTGAGAVLNSFNLQAGESIVVAGAGSVGLAAVMAAKYAGAATIIAVDLHQNRLALATKYGATSVVTVHPSELSAAVHAAAPGGVDYALDTTGNAAVLRGLHDSLGPLGTLGLCGVGFGEVALDISTLLSGRKIIGIVEGDAIPRSFIPRLLKMNSDGLFPYDELITDFPFSQINEAEARSRSGETIKPVMKF